MMQKQQQQQSSYFSAFWQNIPFWLFLLPFLFHLMELSSAETLPRLASTRLGSAEWGCLISSFVLSHWHELFKIQFANLAGSQLSDDWSWLVCSLGFACGSDIAKSQKAFTSRSDIYDRPSWLISNWRVASIKALGSDGSSFDEFILKFWQLYQ